MVRRNNSLYVTGSPASGQQQGQKAEDPMGRPNPEVVHIAQIPGLGHSRPQEAGTQSGWLAGGMRTGRAVPPPLIP